jgi:oxygen-independent coproporphyrinogen-3 oxidase
MSSSVFSLYIHIPYCLVKCPYCDFNSHAAREWPERRYTDALLREIDRFAGLGPWRGGRLGTIFFGGGTPSLFEPASIGRVIAAATAAWPKADAGVLEVTLEANPGSVDEAKLCGFRSAGVNRMSFGVQSFTPHHLQTLGRIHDGPQAVAALRGARAAGFDNVSLDLIFALPRQQPAEWRADLAQACALEPNHVSAYNLTYEEGTPFHHWRAAGRLQSLPEETELEMFNDARSLLAAAGYGQYEISNYARPGRECRHNLNYWRSGAYLGIGAGAHSYAGPGSSELSSSARPEPVEACPERSRSRRPAWGRRWSNRKGPGLYMEAVENRGDAIEASEELDERQARGEFAFLGLRCLRGFAAGDFVQRFGCDVDEAFPHLEGLRRDGLLQREDEYVSLTERGLLVADSVFATFL